MMSIRTRLVLPLACAALLGALPPAHAGALGKALSKEVASRIALRQSLTNAERQSIFENEMLPALRECDFDTEMSNAMGEIDATATAEHALDLQLDMQVDAVTGLIEAPLLLVGLVGWAGW